MIQKHLSFNDREKIQLGIEKELSYSEIGRNINKSHTSISREIKAHRELKQGNFYNRIACVNYNACPKKFYNCHLTCKDIVRIPCTRRDKIGACNGCENKRKCHLDKYFYYAKDSQKSYKTLLINSRKIEKIKDNDDISIIAEKIKPLLKQGQSLYQIVTNHPELKISSTTLYRYIRNGKFKEYNIDLFSLRRTVSRKSNKKNTNQEDFKKTKTWYQGREYKDYVEFRDNNPTLVTTEMDTVYNDASGPYIQTFIFESSGFMIGFIKDKKTNLEMSNSLNTLQDMLADNEYKKLFSLLLTDRGSEFARYDWFEVNQETAEIRGNIFYCDPQRPDQKPHVENNHNFVRDCIPNGASLKELKQKDINLMFSHINSTPRKSLNNKTPYEMFSFLYGEEIIKKLKIKKIPKDTVNLSPSVFKK